MGAGAELPMDSSWYDEHEPIYTLTDEEYAMAFGLKQDEFATLKPTIANMQKICNPGGVKHKVMRKPFKEQYVETFLKHLPMFGNAPHAWTRHAICRMTEKLAVEAKNDRAQSVLMSSFTPDKIPIPAPKPKPAPKTTQNMSSQAGRKRGRPRGSFALNNQPDGLPKDSNSRPKRPTPDREIQISGIERVSVPRKRQNPPLHSEDELDTSQHMQPKAPEGVTIKSNPVPKPTHTPALTPQPHKKPFMDRELQIPKLKTPETTIHEPKSAHKPMLQREAQAEDLTKPQEQLQPRPDTAGVQNVLPRPQCLPEPAPQSPPRTQPVAQPEPVVFIKDEPNPDTTPSQVIPKVSQSRRKCFAVAQSNGNNAYILFSAVTTGDGVSWSLLKEELQQILGTSFTGKVLLESFWRLERDVPLVVCTQATLYSALELLEGVVNVRVTPVQAQG